APAPGSAPRSCASRSTTSAARGWWRAPPAGSCAAGSSATPSTRICWRVLHTPETRRHVDLPDPHHLHRQHLPLPDGRVRPARGRGPGRSGRPGGDRLRRHLRLGGGEPDRPARGSAPAPPRHRERRAQRAADGGRRAASRRSGARPRPRPPGPAAPRARRGPGGPDRADGARLRAASRRGHRHPRPLVRGRERLRARLGADRRGHRRHPRPRARGARRGRRAGPAGPGGGALMSTEAAHEPAGALQTAAALRDGELEAQELAEQALTAARGAGAQVGAFAHLLEDLTREQARAVAERLEEARRSGGLEELSAQLPLLGVPLPIKDLTQIAGAPFEAGSAALAGNIATLTDGVAQQILDAGTLTIGKTSTPEFGLPCYTEPATGAPARTPWDLRRTAGGSSGGAAAAVATGVVPLAHGSDGGGSVRIPAACCGIVGLKPSRGVVSPGPY